MLPGLLKTFVVKVQFLAMNFIFVARFSTPIGVGSLSYFNKSLKSMQLPEHISQIRVGGAFPLIKNGDYAGIVDRIAKMELLQNIR